MAGLDFKKAIKKAAEAKSAPPPSKPRGPYSAAHTPRMPDNEWEVRDGNGVLVQRVVGADFETAKRRCEWLADKLNEAWEIGRAVK